MSLLKSPWFWGVSAVSLLFMNSKSKADELTPAPPKKPAAPKPKPKPPVATTPAPNAPTGPVPGAEGGGKSPVPQTFVVPVIPKTARVVTAFADPEGTREYQVAQLGGGEYLVISKSNDAYLKFGQDGEIESGGATPEALALLRSDMQKFDKDLFNPRKRGQGI